MRKKEQTRKLRNTSFIDSVPRKMDNKGDMAGSVKDVVGSVKDVAGSVKNKF